MLKTLHVEIHFSVILRYEMASVLDDYDENFSSLLSEEYEETLSTTLSTTELMSDDDIEPLATEEQAEEYAFEVEV